MAKDDVPQPLGAAAIRRSDIEPYTALRWVGTLFKAAAVFLAIALLTEVVIGLQIDGLAALPELLGELARTVVVAIALWGVGDLVRLVIQVGHDVRAQRILLGRLASRDGATHQRQGIRGGDDGGTRSARREPRIVPSPVAGHRGGNGLADDDPAEVDDPAGDDPDGGAGRGSGGHRHAADGRAASDLAASRARPRARPPDGAGPYAPGR